MATCSCCSHAVKEAPLPHSSAAELLQEASRCVACGLCLPHCPTYRKTFSETDSPRGRILMMQGALEARIPINESFVRRIDSCLTCRACEAACPSQVRYGRLVNGMRGMIEKSRPRKSWKELHRSRLLRSIATSPALLQIAGYALKLNRIMGAPLPLPAADFRGEWREVYPATANKRGGVALFLGCFARVLDTRTLRAAIFVLNRLGYTVHVPQGQTCCGALHLHGGEPEAAARLAQQNVRVFAQFGAITSTASGCAAALNEYPEQLKAGEKFAPRVADICAFLAQASGWEDVRITPLAARVAVHEPCTLRNVLKGQDAVYALLQRIPQAKIEPLPGNDQCCGAAGDYHLREPEMAGLLLTDKTEAVREAAPDYLVTSNFSCAMHLAKGIRAAGMKTEVLHPVALLARQMAE